MRSACGAIRNWATTTRTTMMAIAASWPSAIGRNDSQTADRRRSCNPRATVVAEVPPEVVGEILRPAVELPAAADLEGVVVDDEDAARPIAGYRAERADVDPIRSAMAGVWAAVARAVRDFLRFDRLDDARRARIRLGVDDVDPRRADAGGQQVTALDMGMRGVRAERGAARVPTEMMELVTGVGRRQRV